MRGVFAILILSTLLVACSQKQLGLGRDGTDGAALSRQALANPAWPRETVAYRCEGGVRLQAAYLNTASGESFAALYYDGRLSLLRVARSASGARYVSMDEQVGLRWHTKRGMGILSFLAADHMAEEITLLSDCQAVAGTD